MKVTNMNEIPKEPFVGPQGTRQIMTGPGVTIQPLVHDSNDFIMNLVNFTKGVRNKFHTHLFDQILIVTAGEGIVTTDELERAVTAGDVILIPAGEKHWHGAIKDSEFSHIALHRKGEKTTQQED
ncbi:cupin domain-containing protein [Chloroflexota bacterium]